MINIQQSNEYKSNKFKPVLTGQVQFKALNG